MTEVNLITVPDEPPNTQHEQSATDGGVQGASQTLGSDQEADASGNRSN